MSPFFSDFFFNHIQIWCFSKHLEYPQMRYAGIYLQWAISTLFSHSPYSPPYQFTPPEISQTSQYQCPKKRYAGISPHERYQFFFSPSPYSHLLHPIPHTINLPLLKPSIITVLWSSLSHVASDGNIPKDAQCSETCSKSIGVWWIQSDFGLF